LTTHRLIFLPGVGADPNFWRPLGDRLPAAWGKVYLGWPGLGHQPPRADVNGWEDLVRLVEHDLGDEPCDLLAQSMGGAVALATALKHPGRVRRLVLSVTAGGIDVSALVAADWRGAYHVEYPNAARWVLERWGDRSAEIAQVRQPTLLIFGDADPIAPVAVGERLAELLPNATLRVLAGGDHGLVASRPAEIAGWICDHLA
jgi:pimeloyl-ACP methyl ester carboxylesterase